MRVRTGLGLIAPLAALSLASSTLFAQRDAEDWLDQCRRDSRRSDRARYCEVRELGMRADDSPLTVDAGQNGAVAVRAWDRDSIHVSARVQAQAEDEDEARDVARDIRIEVSRGTVRSDGPSMRRGTSWAVSYEILVPRRTDLRVDTRNGPIAVERVVGRMELTAENGPLSLDAIGGDVRARTTNGPIRVSLEGRRWEGAGLDAETTNGPIVLTIPERYSARLETGTVNGPMSIDFPITVQGRLSNRISVDLGSGGPPVRVVTTNGPVTVRRQ
jgi:DUF4097 and DUF4098 domain-containing protein YvlB